jgi:hypothetical protein
MRHECAPPTGQLGARCGMPGARLKYTRQLLYATECQEPKRSTSIRLMARTSASLRVMAPAAGQNATVELSANTDVRCRAGG